MKRLLQTLALSTLVAACCFGQTIATTSTSVLAGGHISAAQSGTLYYAMNGFGTSNATETNAEIVMPVAGTITGLYGLVPSTISTATLILTVDHNGSPSTMTCTISATACNDTAAGHAITIAAGDTIDVSGVWSTSTTTANAIGLIFTTTGSSAGTVYNNHTLFTGSAPTISACGTSPSDTNATDNAGTVTLGSGTVTSCTVTFATAFTNAPSVQLSTNSPSSSAAYISALSTTAFTVTFPYTGATYFKYTAF